MAAGSSRDVELVIRAREDANKAISSVADALKILLGVQEDVGASAGKTDGLLGQLAASLGDLQRQAQGLQAMGTVAKQIDRASDAIERLEKISAAAGDSAEGLKAKHEELAAGGEKLAGSLAQAKVALEAEQGALAQSEAEHAKLAQQVTRAGVAYNESLRAMKAAKEPSDALQATYRAQRGQLLALVEQQLASERSLTSQGSRVATLTSEYASLTRQVGANSVAQERTQRDADAASASFQRTQETLAKAREVLGEMTQTGENASQALGGVAVNQEAVSAASKTTADSIDRVTAAMKRQAAAPETSALGPAAGATAAYRAQLAAVQQAREAYEAARAEATRLGQALASADGPARQLNTEFVLAKTAAAEAREAYQGQAAAMNALKGVAQGSFAAFHQLAEGLQATGAASTQAGVGLRSLPPIASQANAEARPLYGTLRDLLVALFQIPEAAGAAGNGIRSIGDGSRQSLSMVQRLRGEVLSLITAYFGLYGAIRAIGSVVSTLASVQNAQARLNVVFDGDMAKSKNEITFLMGLAERLGFSFSSLSTEYTKVAIAAKEMNFTNAGTREIFTAIAESARVAGLDVSETDGVFQGLSHSIDRGVLNARNFNNQIGMRIPGSMKAMADAVGVTIQKFDQLQKSGGGVAANEDTLVRFAQNLSAEYSGQLPKSLDTITAQLERLKTFAQEGALQIGNAGFADSLKGLIDDLTTFTESGGGAKTFEDIGHALAGLVDALKFVASNFGLVIHAAELFIALKIASSVLGLVQANGALGSSLKAARADVAAMTGALGALNWEKVANGVFYFRAQVLGAGAALAEMGAEGAIAAAGNAVVSASLAALEGIMVAVAATARAMWVAIGGFPGLIITAATFIISQFLGTWITGVNNATDALDAHEKLLQRVKDDYEKAAQAADDFAKKALTASRAQIEADQERLHNQIADARGLRDVINVGAGGANETNASYETAEKLQALIEQFRGAKISVAEFKKALDELSKADPKLDRILLGQLADNADKVADLTTKLREDDAMLAVIRGTATDAQRALLGLADAAGQVNAAFDPTKLDQYNDALQRMGKLTPDGKQDQKTVDDQTSAQQDLKQALTDSHLGLHLNDAQIQDIIATGLKPIVGATADQMALVKKAYDTYTQTMAKIAADSAHRKDQALSEAVGKSLDGFIAAYFKAEGGDGKNPNSSANGFGQFTKGTWLGNGKSPGLFDQAFPNLIGLSDVAKLNLRHDPEVAKKVAQVFFEQIMAQLAEANIDPTYRNLYMGAFLGPQGAPRMIKAGQTNPNAPASEFAGADQVAANRNVFFKRGKQSAPRTVEELLDFMGSRIGQGSGPEQSYQANGLTKQQEFDAQLTEFIKSLKDATAAIGQSARDAFIQQKVDEQDKRAQSEGVTFGPEQRAAVTKAAGDQFDANKLADEKKTVAEMADEYDRLIKGADNLTRDEFIRNEALAKGVNLLDAQGQKFAVIAGKIFDLNKGKQAFDSVTGLAGQRTEIAGQLQGAFKEGDVDKVKELQAEISDITRKLKDALPDAVAFATAMGDQKMLATLDKIQLDLAKTKVSLTDAKTINQQLAQGLTGVFTDATNALGKFVSGSGQLKDVFKAAGLSFLQFSANFLQKIAEMIVQQQLLNLLSKSPIGSWITGQVNAAGGLGGSAGGAASLSSAGATLTTAGTSLNTAGATVNTAGGILNTAGAALNAAAVALQAAAAASAGGSQGGGIGGILGSLFGGDAAAGEAGIGSGISDGADFLASLAHGGGIAGVPGGGMSRSVWPGIFANARRMHGGGIAGLASDEIPTILKRNEEVLTESNPRHAWNASSGQGGGGSPGHSPVKIINAFDAATVLSEALNTAAGEKAMVNHVRARARRYTEALRG